MLYYKLDSLNPNKLLNDVINFINSQNVDKTKSILIVQIREVASDDSTMIPKLEHKKM